MTYLTTIMMVSVHKPGQSPHHSEGVTHIRIEEEGAGCFFVLHQSVPFDTREPSEIAIDPEELQALAEAGKMLLAQPGLQDGAA